MKPEFTGRKAQYLNYAEDGIRLRANRIGSKKVYNRKKQSWKKELLND